MFFRVRMNNLSIRVFLGAVPIRIIEVLLYLDFERSEQFIVPYSMCVCVLLYSDHMIIL